MEVFKQGVFSLVKQGEKKRYYIYDECILEFEDDSVVLNLPNYQIRTINKVNRTLYGNGFVNTFLFKLNGKMYVEHQNKTYEYHNNMLLIKEE